MSEIGGVTEREALFNELGTEEAGTIAEDGATLTALESGTSGMGATIVVSDCLFPSLGDMSCRIVSFPSTAGPLFARLDIDVPIAPVLSEFADLALVVIVVVRIKLLRSPVVVEELAKSNEEC